jgi:hypothetical protein
MEGRLWLDITYKDGIKDGWMTTYDSAGKINSKTYYKADKQEGPSRYYKKGCLTKSIEYSKGCPIRASYFGKGGKATRVLTVKKEIWLEEGKPIGCN